MTPRVRVWFSDGLEMSVPAEHGQEVIDAFRNRAQVEWMVDGVLYAFDMAHCTRMMVAEDK